jgi:hypothetical protein
MSLDEQDLLCASIWFSNNKENLFEKKTRDKQLRINLLIWIKMNQSYPFPSLIDKKYVADLLKTHVNYVNNFCNNYRKRYVKLGKKKISYSELHHL